MPLPVTAAAALAGRLLLAAIFLHEAWSKLTGYSAALAYMQAFGVPGQLLPLAIAVEVGCGGLILCGYHTRAAALLLAGFCLVTAVLFHTKFGDRNRASRAVRPWRRRMGPRCAARIAKKKGAGCRGSGRTSYHLKPARSLTSRSVVANATVSVENWALRPRTFCAPTRLIL